MKSFVNCTILLDDISITSLMTLTDITCNKTPSLFNLTWAYQSKS